MRWALVNTNRVVVLKQAPFSEDHQIRRVFRVLHVESRIDPRAFAAKRVANQAILIVSGIHEPAKGKLLGVVYAGDALSLGFGLG